MIKSKKRVDKFVHFGKNRISSMFLFVTEVPARKPDQNGKRLHRTSPIEKKKLKFLSLVKEGKKGSRGV